MKYIAMTQRVQVLPDINERRDSLSQEWAFLSCTCGFLPLLLPNVLPVAEQMLNTIPVCGIMLTGGNDLVSYGGDAPERDEVEHWLVEHAIRHKIPLLGVCRGMQLLLDHFGTPLERVEHHVRVHHPLKTGERVNSYHSFGATQCLPPLQAMYWSEDGVLEGLQHGEFPWIRGIMWHPEREHPMKEQDINKMKEWFRL